ncbi:peptidase inhibitor family I36 protein [Streptomyces sp. NBC_00015]|uniref:peptidase inhibitor family I36 protein n=1 Tax=Streptomyces sp. NBC_00015 TaxID=2903611 RepID=UPI002F90E8E2
MGIHKKLGAVAATLALAGAGILATTSTAQAVGGCPSGKLCLYTSENYSGLFFTMASTAACLDIKSDVNSYVNNLPVEVKMYQWGVGGYYHTATIRAGGSSSDTGVVPFWGRACTGGVNPN